MALIKCGECENDVSDKAKTCPKCGAKVKVPKKQWKDLGAFQKLAGLAVVGVVGYAAFSSGGGVYEATEYPKSTNAVSTTAAAPAAVPGWQYGESEDKMRGKKTPYATVDAVKKLDFKFPYNGGSTATLVIFGGKAVSRVELQVEKGQFLQKQMFLKFDNGPVVSSNVFGDAVVESGGHSNRVILALNHERAFVEKVRKAKRLTIEAQFFHESSQQMEFNVQGYRF